MVTTSVSANLRDGAKTQSGKSDIISQFWSVWLEQEKKLYNRCLALMNGNVTEAKDALSSAMLKAWEKVQKFADSIRDLKAWLMQLTSNECKDINKKNSRGPVGVEDIEWVGDNGVLCTASGVATPMMVLEREELYEVIRQAVEELPQGQRDAFILHYYEELKHQEIVDAIGISYDSVCQQISKARKRLKTQLQGYFRDEEELERALEPKGKKSPTPRGRAKKRSQQQNASNPNSEQRTENRELRLEEVSSTATQTPISLRLQKASNPDDGVVQRTQNSELAVDSGKVSSSVAQTVISGGVENDIPNSDFSLTEQRTPNSEGRTPKDELVKAPVGSSMEEGSALGLAQMLSPTPLFIVDQQNILSDDRTGMVSASVTAGSSCTADDVMARAPVIVEHESYQDCTLWEAREPVGAPVASGEQLLCSPLDGETVSTAREWVPVRDIVGKNILDVSGNVSVSSPLPTLPAIVEKQRIQFSEELGPQTAAVSAGSMTVPVTVAEKHSFFSGSVAFLAFVGEKIMDFCGQGIGRSHFKTPPDIVEKRTRPLGEELSFETVTVRAARLARGCGPKTRLCQDCWAS